MSFPEHSYPEPVYHGDGGEVSARLVPGDAPPTLDSLPRSTCTYLATGASTGGIHGFTNNSGEPASMLLLFAPGAPREEYFEVLAELARGRELAPDERDEFMLRHDNIWV